MQVFDITLPTNGAGFVVHAAGRYIKYTVGNAGGNDTSVVVTPGMAGGSKITLLPGQAYRVADDAPVPDSWTLANNLGQAVITGKVVVGNGRIDDNQLQGTVQVVDGGKARTLANMAFAGQAGIAAATGVYGRVGIYNPVGSGTRLVVKQILATANNPAMSTGLLLVNAQLGTDNGTQYSKLAGGAQSVAHLQSDTNAVVGPAKVLLAIGSPASTGVPYQFTEPIIVTPGWALVAWSYVANEGYGINFEWLEEPNV
ncbi:hypothetical protein [Burkholderia sp. F1]|uniref:hypothetical protein n=1 Tax=Burkholderia sp. F1 TaxID=3366817 RepID=UPI003D7615F8